MDRLNSKSVFATLAVLALILGLSLVPAGTPTAPEGQVAPSYDSLQALLRDGKGKGLDRGLIDVWASTSPTPHIPTAWVWVVDDTVDGSGVEYWAYHAEFVHPGADEDVSLTYSYRDNVDPTSLDEFLDWVVANNVNVGNRAELRVVVNTVRPVK